MGWQDAPIVEDNAQGGNSPAWMSAPVVDERPSSFLGEIGANFRNGISSAKDLLSGNYEDIGRTRPTPRTEALANKLFPEGSKGSFMGAMRNIGDTSPSDWSGALLEKFGDTPEGKALSAIGGIVPSYNVAGAAINRYINPAISRVTGIAPENLQLAELGGAAFAGAKMLKNKWTADAAPEADAAPVESLSPEMQKVYKRLRADYPKDADFVQALRDYTGSDQSLVEAGGKRTAGLAEGAGMYQAGGAKAMDFFDESTDAAAGKLKSSAAKYISPNTDYYQTLDDITTQGRANAEPLYAGAFKENKSVASPEIDRALSTPAGLRALRDTAVTLQNSGKRLGIPDAEITEQAKLAGTYEPGDGGIASGLNLRTLDLVKQNLDRQYRMAASGQDPIPGLPQGILDVKNDLVSELDRLDVTAKAGPKALNPDGGIYAKARATAGDYLTNQAAMEKGLGFFKTDPALVKRDFSAMGEGEQTSYKTGILKSAYDRIDRLNDGRNVDVLFNNPANRGRLRAILGDDDYTALAKDASSVDKLFKLRNQITGGSRTAMRQVAASEFDNIGQEMAQNVATHGIKGGAIIAAKNYIVKAFDGINDKSAGKVADILFEKDPQKKLQFVQQLKTAAEKSGRPLMETPAGKQLGAYYGMERLPKYLNAKLNASNAARLAAPLSIGGKNVAPQNAPAVPTQPQPTPQHISLLQTNPQKYSAHFDEAFGQGAAQQVLNPASLPVGAQTLPADLVGDEGRTNSVYSDTQGNKTVGIGFNMDSGIAKKIWKQAGVQTPFNDVRSGKTNLNDSEVTALAHASYQVALNDATKLFPGFSKLSDSRQQALLNLSYQMGADKLSGFRNFRTALNSGDYRMAARELARSDWWKQTQDSRKNRIIQQIAIG